MGCRQHSLAAGYLSDKSLQDKKTCGQHLTAGVAPRIETPDGTAFGPAQGQMSEMMLTSVTLKTFALKLTFPACTREIPDLLWRTQDPGRKA
jgi:hypothetical protein